MRRLLSIIIIAAMALSLGLAAAEEGYRIIRCEDQGFSTLCNPKCEVDYHPDAGVTISTGEGDAGAVVRMNYAEGGTWTPEIAKNYLDNVYAEQLEREFDDDLINPGSYRVFPIVGHQLHGKISTYRDEDDIGLRLCMFDLRDDGFVQFDAWCDENSLEDALKIIGVAAGNLQPDPHYYDKQMGK